MSTIPFSPKQKPDESTLTDRQRKVLDAIRTHIDEQGFAPSFREIGNAAGLKSPSSVKHQLQVLEDKGFIRMNANKGRAIEVVAGSAPNAEKPSQASEEATSTSNVAEIYQFPAEAIAESHDVPLLCLCTCSGIDHNDVRTFCCKPLMLYFDVIKLPMIHTENPHTSDCKFKNPEHPSKHKDGSIAKCQQT